MEPCPKDSFVGRTTAPAPLFDLIGSIYYFCDLTLRGWNTSFSGCRVVALAVVRVYRRNYIRIALSVLHISVGKLREHDRCGIQLCEASAGCRLAINEVSHH